MESSQTLFLGKAEDAVNLDLRYANRHGLIAGATGTGKTVTLQVLAEGFSQAGVPVFIADVKGDLSGLCQPGTLSDKLRQRAMSLGLSPYEAFACPAVFWDVFGAQGHPVRTTVSELGPMLLGRLLELNDTQEGVLHIAFAVADDEGLLLLDLKDLRSMLAFLAENAGTLSKTYGNVSAASVSAIQRRLLVLEREGGDRYFGEPALDLQDLIRTDQNGRGHVNILVADELIHKPKLYATVMFWLLSELFEELPERGDADKPILVLFFDEAHLLFDQAPRPLLEKVEQVVRLIRSKGVGVFFITQNPTDLPDDILGQLGNRFQHALRAFTARDQKAVRAAAETFRLNPAFDAEQAITELEVGEALVSTLESKGIPGIVQRTLIRPPSTHLGPAPEAVRAGIVRSSPFAIRYDNAIDRLSAYEHLEARAQAAMKSQQQSEAQHNQYRDHGGSRRARPATRRRRDTATDTAIKSVARSVGRSLGKELVRGILGSLFRGR
ncbi:MAG: DUF853 family protein [Hyphomicrobiales bacterium]|nr:DUF853 family protein [Hyphomicrobiales bacterium]